MLRAIRGDVDPELRSHFTVTTGVKRQPFSAGMRRDHREIAAADKHQPLPNCTR